MTAPAKMKCPPMVQRNSGSIDGSGLAAKAKLLKKNLAAKLAKLKNKKKKETLVDGHNNASADLASKAKLLKESLKNKLAKLKAKDTNGDGGEVVEKERSVDKGTKQNPYLAHRNTAGRNRKVGKPNNYNSYKESRAQKGQFHSIPFDTTETIFVCCREESTGETRAPPVRPQR